MQPNSLDIVAAKDKSSKNQQKSLKSGEKSTREKKSTEECTDAGDREKTEVKLTENFSYTGKLEPTLLEHGTLKIENCSSQEKLEDSTSISVKSLGQSSDTEEKDSSSDRFVTEKRTPEETEAENLKESIRELMEAETSEGSVTEEEAEKCSDAKKQKKSLNTFKVEESAVESVSQEISTETAKLGDSKPIKNSLENPRDSSEETSVEKSEATSEEISTETSKPGDSKAIANSVENPRGSSEESSPEEISVGKSEGNPAATSEESKLNEIPIQKSEKSTPEDPLIEQSLENLLKKSDELMAELISTENSQDSTTEKPKFVKKLETEENSGKSVLENSSTEEFASEKKKIDEFPALEEKQEQPRIKVATFARIGEEGEIIDSPERSEEDYDPIVKEEIDDEDVLNQLDELEEFAMQSPQYESSNDGALFNKYYIKDEDMKDEVDCKPHFTLEDGEIPSVLQTKENNEELTTEQKREAMYNQRLHNKEMVAKDRFRSLAGAVESNFPVYKVHLTKVEKEGGNHFCKLEDSRHAPWNSMHINRWKFKYSRIISHEQDGNKIQWKLEPNNMLVADLEDRMIFPSIILEIVSFFEEFLNSSELLQKEATKYNFSNLATRKEFTALTMRANCNNEVMVVIIGYNIMPHMIEALKKYMTTELDVPPSIISLYCKSYLPQVVRKNYSTTSFLFGQRYITEVIGKIQLQLTPRSHFWSNVSGLQVLLQTINDFFTPLLENTTLVEIGCGIGLISLMMANKFQSVIGFDSNEQVDEAEVTRKYNEISNVKFVKDLPENVNRLFKDLKNHEKVNAIINHSSKSAQSIDIITNLRKVLSLKRLVFVTTCNKQSQQAMMELMRPADDGIGNPFFPVRACIVDMTPENENFEILVLMQRRVMRKIKTEPMMFDWEDSSLPKRNDPKQVIDVEEVYSKKRPHDDGPRKLSKRMENRLSYNLPRPKESRYNHGPKSAEKDDITETVKQQQAILEEAANKLDMTSMDPQMAKQLKDMLSIAIEQTNKLHSKLPQMSKNDDSMKQKYKSRRSRSPSPKFSQSKIIVEKESEGKYKNVMPLEPNLILPVGGRRPKMIRTAAELIAKKEAKRKQVERQRLNVMQQNGWGPNCSPPRFLQEGSPPREMPVPEPDPGWVSPPNSSPKRYPSVLYSAPVKLPVPPSPPRYFSPPCYNIEISKSPPRKQKPTKHKAYCPPIKYKENSPPKYRNCSPQKRPTSSSSSTRSRSRSRSKSLYSRSPKSRYSRSPKSRYSRSPKSRYSRSPKSRYSRSPKSRYSRSPKSRYSRSYSRSRSPTPTRQRQRSPRPRRQSPIYSPLQSPYYRYDSRKRIPSPPSPAGFQENWDIESNADEIVVLENKSRHRRDNSLPPPCSPPPPPRQVKEKKKTKKRKRSPENFMEWHKPHLIEFDSTRLQRIENSMVQPMELDSSPELSQSRDPRRLQFKNNGKEKDQMNNSEENITENEASSNTWINGNGMPVMNTIPPQWPPPGNMGPPGNFPQWMPNNQQAPGAMPYMYPNMYPYMYPNNFGPQNEVQWQAGPSNFNGPPPNFPPGQQQFGFEQMN